MSKMKFRIPLLFITLFFSTYTLAETYVMCGQGFNIYESGDTSVNANSAADSPNSYTFESESQYYFGLSGFEGSRFLPNTPQGRMLDALWVVKHAGPGDHSWTYDSTNSGILKWAYKMATDNTDELHPTCESHTHFVNDNTGFPQYKNVRKMYFNGDWLFNGDLISRAAVVVHEARHKYVSHIADSACARGGSCDSFNSFGADYYEALWLFWFAVDASPLFNDAYRQIAADRANAIYATAFDYPNAGYAWARTGAARNARLNHDSFTATGIESPAYYVAPTPPNPKEIRNVSQEYCYRSYSNVNRWVSSGSSLGTCYLN